MKKALAISIFLTCVALPYTVFSQVFYFTDHQTIPLGGSMYGSANADLNNDTYTDLVVANYNGNINVFYGDGTGTFSNPIVYTPPGTVGTYFCRGVTIADFNTDGHNDIAVACQSTSTVGVVCIFINNGTDFNVGVNYNSTINGSPNGIVSADFDKDGKLDLAVSNGYSGHVASYKGNGDGTFAAAVVIGNVMSQFGIDAADFNGDTYMDIVCGRNYSTGQILILINNQNGTFTTNSYNCSYYTMDVVAKDFDKDGIPDVAAVGKDTYKPSLCLGNADGSMNTQIVSGVAKSHMDVDAFDYNMDGTLDLVTSPETGSYINLLKGLTAGTFGGPVAILTANSPTSTTTADFNNDGRPDIAAISLHSLKILLNTINEPTLVFSDANFTIGTTGNFMTASSNSDGALLYTIHSGDAIAIDPVTGEVTLNHTGTAVVKVFQAAASDNSSGVGVRYATATVSSTTPTLQASTGALISVNYNSSEGKIYISTSEEIEYTVLSNMSGQSEIHQGKEFETSMKGILVISVVTKKQTVTDKVVMY